MREETYRDYDQTFRDEAVRLVRQGPRTLASVARDLGMTTSTLGRWYRMDMARKGKPPKGTPSKSTRLPVSDPDKETPDDKIARLERENAQLRKQNESLQMDRAILKKAAAFFAKESE